MNISSPSGNEQILRVLSAGGQQWKPAAGPAVRQEGEEGTNIFKALNTAGISESDLVLNLENIKVPATKENVNMAKTMVEFGIPLSRENMSQMGKALEGESFKSQFSMTAAGFLKANSIPLSRENVTVLAWFLEQNPRLGEQLFNVQQYFREILERDSKNQRIRAFSSLVERYIIESGRKENMEAVLIRLAEEAGIKKAKEPEGMAKHTERLAKGISGDAEENGLIEKAVALMKGLEENFAAQRMLNLQQKNPGSEVYYMQVPIKLRDENLTAELKITRRKGQAKEKTTESESFRIEFTVDTENLGKISFSVDIAGDIINLEVGTDSPEAGKYIKERMGRLTERLTGIPYQIGEVLFKINPELRPVFAPEKLETMERIDVSA
ncbi:MAG: flagellar hook-length control protein FliK [Firmicutes bacterium]|nr:flagellar hook-length control protein FliK [Bacillota bacterium]